VWKLTLDKENAKAEQQTTDCQTVKFVGLFMQVSASQPHVGNALWKCSSEIPD
jgi:hypothetical protein